MTFENLEILRSEMTDEDIVRADELTALLEIAAEKHPHKRLPRSFRFIGAGLGCIEVLCIAGVYRIFRNDGSEPMEILQCKDMHDAFVKLAQLMYAGIAEPNCAEDFSPKRRAHFWRSNLQKLRRSY